jgi:hypothetical protein
VGNERLDTATEDYVFEATCTMTGFVLYCNGNGLFNEGFIKDGLFTHKYSLFTTEFN